MIAEKNPMMNLVILSPFGGLTARARPLTEFLHCRQVGFGNKGLHAEGTGPGVRLGHSYFCSSIKQTFGLLTAGLILRVAYSPELACDLSSGGKVDRIAEGICEYGQNCFCEGECAGCTRESAGSSGDLELKDAVGVIGGEIDAIVALSLLHVEQAAIAEAEYSSPGRFGEVELI
jgi:hypothetical protein